MKKGGLDRSKPMSFGQGTWWSLALLGLVIVLAATLRVVIIRNLDFYLQEDALITMRYAENIAQGRGFVYNPGERVLGTTTPLYTLILAGMRALGLDILRFGPLLNLVCALVAVLLVFRWLYGLGKPWIGLLAAALLALSPKFIFVSAAGMETALFVLLAVVALHAFTARHYNLSAIALAVLVLTRPDGILLAAVMAVAYLAQHRSIPWKPLALFVLILAPWMIFGTLYFGLPIPNSALAKVAAYSQGQAISLLASAKRVFTFLRSDTFGPWIGTAVGLGFLVGCYEAVTRERRLLPTAAWTAAYFLILILFRPGHFFHWYFLTPLGAYCAVAALGLAGIARRLAAAGSALGRRAWPIVAGLLVVVTLVGSGFDWQAQYQSQYRTEAWWANYERTFRKAIGVWLHDNTPSDATVLLEPLGYIGYYSQRHMIDVVGLVSPQLSSIRKQAPLRQTLGQIIRLVPADYLVLRESEIVWVTGSDLDYLNSRYREVTQFPDPNPTLAFRIFEKIR